MSSLHIVVYHYVRDLPRTPFPRIRGMLLEDFENQVAALAGSFEMATLESALAYLSGAYSPRRDLCLMTFDDGLREHYAEVTPILAARRIQGLFFVITSCADGRAVAPVHMNHFLMAALDFAAYREAFLGKLHDMDPETGNPSPADAETLRRTYPWDSAEVAAFKYFFNFQLDAAVRDRVVAALFQAYLGSPAPFSGSLYFNWEEARAMQAAGMVIGGHSHRHRPLAALSGEELNADIAACREALDRHLAPQPQWPFCYPYGKKDSYNPAAIDALRRSGFCCSFTTETRENLPGQDLFEVSRVDCKCAPAAGMPDE